jgi:F-type H+-transporting ATPase subunit beta
MNATAACPQTGSVTAVRGGIVDVRFSSQLPSIQSLLLTGKSGEVLIEVLFQLDAHNVLGARWLSWLAAAWLLEAA